MVNKDIPELSKAEYDIMRILWKHGKLSIREVHDELISTYNWAYSTTKTMMDRMVKKNLLKREEFHRVFLYKTLITKPQGIMKWVEFFADRVLEMDMPSTIALFGKTKALKPDEIEELEKLLKDNQEKE